MTQQYFAAIDTKSYTAYGIGTTQEAARKDAAVYTDTPDRLAILPCSEALYQKIEQVGGNAVLTVHQGRAVLSSEIE